MIAISKCSEPIELAQLRQKISSSGLSSKEAYKKLKNPLKAKIRQSLVDEQGHLCAYCMCKIPRKDVEANITPITIEHEIPQSPVDCRSIGQGLDYNNLVAVCHGNRGPHGTRTILDLTCDAHKGNDEFRTVNPHKGETLTSIFYTTDGKIDSTNPDVKHDLFETLNLNCKASPIIAERKAALDSLINEISNESNDNILEYCTSVLIALRQETDNKTPYVGILIWYLQSMISSLSTT